MNPEDCIDILEALRGRIGTLFKTCWTENSLTQAIHKYINEEFEKTIKRVGARYLG